MGLDEIADAQLMQAIGGDALAFDADAVKLVRWAAGKSVVAYDGITGLWIDQPDRKVLSRKRGDQSRAIGGLEEQRSDDRALFDDFGNPKRPPRLRKLGGPQALMCFLP